MHRLQAVVLYILIKPILFSMIFQKGNRNKEIILMKSEISDIFVAEILLFFNTLLTCGVIRKIRVFLLKSQHEMPVDQEAVQQTTFQFWFFNQTQCFHVVLSIYVTGLEFHFCFNRGVIGPESFFDDLTEGFDQTGLILADTVPFVLIIRHFQDLPVGRFLAGVLLDKGKHFVHQKCHLQVSGFVDVVSQNIKSLSKILHISPDEFSYFLEVIAPLSCYILPVFFNAIS